MTWQGKELMFTKKLGPKCPAFEGYVINNHQRSITKINLVILAEMIYSHTVSHKYLRFILDYKFQKYFFIFEIQYLLSSQTSHFDTYLVITHCIY